MATSKKNETSITVDVEIRKGYLNCNILGITPLVCNAMSQKVLRGLLSPRKTNAAERQASLKHNPPEEFRGSIYRAKDDAPTRILFPAVGFKKALADTAKDMPGAAKTQIGRLTYVQNEYVDIYGIPQLYMAVVRDASIQRVPDVRTRAILPQWACRVSIEYITPLLKELTVARLLGAAGIMRGIGDGRPEKGTFSFGQFECVADDDPRWLEIMKNGGRKAQDAALADPVPYDNESLELLKWWYADAQQRGFKVAA